LLLILTGFYTWCSEKKEHFHLFFYVPDIAQDLNVLLQFVNFQSIELRVMMILLALYCMAVIQEGRLHEMLCGLRDRS